MIRPIPPFHPVPAVSPGEVDDPPEPPEPHETAFKPEYARFATETSGEVENNVFGLAY